MSKPEKYVEVEIPVPWSDRPIVITIYSLMATAICAFAVALGVRIFS